jgi:16S rRNA (cytosine1402-N4)-methyltransferase
MSDSQLALPGMLEGGAVEWVWCEESEDVTDETRFVHRAVMTDEVVAALAPRPGGVYVDVTFGAGGHSTAILATEGARVIALDRDADALAAAERTEASFAGRLTVVHSNFARVREELERLGIGRVDGLCADLGVSSPQLDDGGRGMSFRREGPLDMRMDRSSETTAESLLEELSDEGLADVIFRYGDEHRSRRIARSIKRALADGDLKTTLDLRRAIVRAVGPVRVGGVDPATRTFQALRIAVNRELEELEALIAALPLLLAPGGVAAILSFHSLEDRLVKRAFHDKSKWAPHWKKPRVASDEETAMNPRARSAKLRAARLVESE